MIHFFDKIRLLPNSRKKPCLFLYDILGFKPKDISIYKLALHHRSKIELGDVNHILNNERLEFLGDAVLGSIIADILYRRYPDKKEGFLTSARSKIVQRSTLNKIAESLNFAKLITAAPYVKIKGDILGSSFESFIGAIYVDAGYKEAYNFIENKILDNFIDMNEIFQKVIDYKSQLNIWAQKNSVDISFDFLQSDTIKGQPIVFHCIIVVNDYKATEAIGSTKREAQQLASKCVLNDIKHSPLLWDKVKKRQFN